MIDKSRYDSDDEEWIIPFVKKKDNDERLPGIGGGNNSNNDNGGGGNTSSRANSARRNNNKNSRGGDGGGYMLDAYAQDKESQRMRPPKDNKEEKHDGSGYGGNENVPALNIPRHAPSKPPIAKNSARRQEKKKNKQEEGSIKSDLVRYCSFDHYYTFLRISKCLFCSDH